MRMDWIATIPGPAADFGTLSEVTAEALDLINEKLALRGTLHVDSIDTAALTSSAHAVLKEAGHVQAYRGAVYAAVAANDADGYETALALGARFFGDGWDGMHPIGEKAARLKSAAAKDLYEMLLKAVRTQPGQAFDSTVAHVELLAQLHDVISARGAFDAAPFAPQDVVAYPQVAQPIESTGPSSLVSSGASGFLDARGRADLRQDILRLAERITTFEPDAGVAAMMRGYAAWMEHRALPDHDETGQTLQSGLPRKMRDDLLATVESPSAEGLARLEERLVHSPDWFDGQHAAALIAKALGRDGLHDAIRVRVQARLTALPGFAELTHPNGEKFLPDAVRNWLEGSARPVHFDTTVAADPDSDVIEADLEDVLSAAEQSLANARCPREAARARIKLAGQLKQEGHRALATAMLSDLLRQIEDARVVDWDSVLVMQIHDLLGSRP